MGTHRKLMRIEREIKFVGNSVSSILFFIFFHVILPMLIDKLLRLGHVSTSVYNSGKLL